MKYAFASASHFLKRTARDTIGHDENTGRDEAEDARLDALRADLGIRTDQMTGWEAFAKTLRGRTLEFLPHVSTPRRNRHPTSIDVLDVAFAQLEQYLLNVAAIRRGLRELYAVLTPRQRLKADRLLPRHCLPLITSGGRKRAGHAIH